MNCRTLAKPAARKAAETKPDKHNYNEAETRDRYIDLLLREAGWALDKPDDLEFRVEGIEHADSFIVDPHKWLFAPFDCCALVYRDPSGAEQGIYRVEDEYFLAKVRDEVGVTYFCLRGPDVEKLGPIVSDLSAASTSAAKASAASGECIGQPPPSLFGK